MRITGLRSLTLLAAACIPACSPIAPPVTPKPAPVAALPAAPNPCAAQSPMRRADPAMDIRDINIAYTAGSITITACVVSDRDDAPPEGGLYVSAGFGVIGTDGSLRTSLGQTPYADHKTYGSFPASPHWRIPVAVSGALADNDAGHIIAPVVAQLISETCTGSDDNETCEGKQNVATTVFVTPARCEPAGTCAAPGRFSPGTCLGPALKRQADPTLHDVRAPIGLVYGKLVALFSGCLVSDRLGALGEVGIDIPLFGASVPSGGPVWQVNAGTTVENAGPMVRRALPGYRLPRSIALLARNSACFQLTPGQTHFEDHSLVRFDAKSCQPKPDGSCTPLPEAISYDVVPIGQ